MGSRVRGRAWGKGYVYGYVQVLLRRVMKCLPKIRLEKIMYWSQMVRHGDGRTGRDVALAH